MLRILPLFDTAIIFVSLAFFHQVHPRLPEERREIPSPTHLNPGTLPLPLSTGRHRIQHERASSMQKPSFLAAAPLILGIALLSSTSHAGEAKPIQVALWSPVQIFPPAAAIHGVRLNIIYGVNTEVVGLDLGIANRTTGDCTGLQYGIIGDVEGTFTGWQDNFINIAKNFEGFQSGLYNGADACHGFQWGFINNTKSMRGFQLAFINMTEKMDGLQIGLVNVIREKNSWPILPIVNWKF